jgi:redox-sensitive bicupin YhaK (pirin superfamily)
MNQLCSIERIFNAEPTIEGAGVKLKRAFGYFQKPLFDPFLLFDDFSAKDSEDYLAGFPWHPHRGIETVTYILDGEVEHGDSLGNKGVIKKGDIQWMTAGSGIIHQEMPQKTKNELCGFQLWVNLPAKHKMTEPRYRDLKREEIPVINENGASIKIITGKYKEHDGALNDIIAQPTYLDIMLEKNTEFVYEKDILHNTFAYIYQGSGLFSELSHPNHKNETILFSKGNQLKIKSFDKPLHFLLISGKPLNEPIAWRGPIVMNTNEELKTAFAEYNSDTFIKNKENT